MSGGNLSGVYHFYTMAVYTRGEAEDYTRTSGL